MGEPEPGRADVHRLLRGAPSAGLPRVAGALARPGRVASGTPGRNASPGQPGGQPVVGGKPSLRGQGQTGTGKLSRGEGEVGVVALVMAPLGNGRCYRHLIIAFNLLLFLLLNFFP